MFADHACNPRLGSSIAGIDYKNKRFKITRAFGVSPGVVREPPRNRKKGVLKKGCLSQDPKPTLFYKVVYIDATLYGKTELENPKLLSSLYLVLKKNIGKPLTEKGDLEI